MLVGSPTVVAMTRFHAFVFIATAAAIFGCTSEEADTTEPKTQTRVAGLTGQTPPNTQFVGRASNCDPVVGCSYMGLGLSGADADTLFWAWPNVSLTGGNQTGSGVFIGPNILLTAAHLGHTSEGGAGPGNFQTWIYDEGAESPSTTALSVPCEFLIQSIGAGDTMLMYCQDVSWAGTLIAPGLLLGYGDFDISPRNVDDPVHAFYWNPECPNPPNQQNCVGPNQIVYAPGTVTDTNSPIYSVAGLKTSLWAATGGSGSVRWAFRQGATGEHKIVTAGQAVGGCAIGTAGCGGSSSASIGALLETGQIDTTNSAEVHENELTLRGVLGGSSGYTLSDYDGSVDKDKNYIFDVQEWIEDVQGERFRPGTYWLGFESPVRNRRWQAFSGTALTFNEPALYVNIDHQGSGDMLLMKQPRINLAPGKRYRVSVMTFTNVADEQESLVFELWQVGGAAPIARHPIPTVVTGDWEMESFYVDTLGVVAHELRFVSGGATQNLNISLAALTLIEEQSPHYFDTHDERFGWRDDMTGRRAWIVPHGKPVLGLEFSWAGVVWPSTSATTNWSLRNRQLAIVPGNQYRVCFEVRSYPAGGGAGTGTIRIKDGGIGGPDHMTTTFEFTDEWKRLCVPEGILEVPNGNNIVQFGHLQGEPWYLVDLLRLEPI